MSNSTDTEFIQKLQTIQDVDWKRNAFELTTHILLTVNRVPSFPGRDTLAEIAIRCLRVVAPVFTDDVVSAWRAARTDRVVKLYFVAIRETAAAALRWM